MAMIELAMYNLTIDEESPIIFKFFSFNLMAISSSQR